MVGLSPRIPDGLINVCISKTRKNSQIKHNQLSNQFKKISTKALLIYLSISS